MSLDHLCVFPGCFGLQLNEDSVEELGDFLGGQSSLAICDEDVHGAELPDPTRHDSLHEVGGALARQWLGHRPTNRLVDEVGDHPLLVEQDVPLHDLIEIARHAGSGHGLGRWPRPHPADPAGVHYILYQLLCARRRTREPEYLHQLGGSNVPEAHVESTECPANDSVVGGVEKAH